jgi:hypothetical protein
MSMTNLECLVTEIIEPLRYPEDYSTGDSIELYNDVLNEIIARLKQVIHSKEDLGDIKDKVIDIIEELNQGKEKIKEIREDIGLCPSCGNRLQTKEYQELRGEYLGFPSYETMYTDVCPNCGWDSNKG